MDSSTQLLRLEAFGCTLHAKAADTVITAVQTCVIDGPANVQGVGIGRVSSGCEGSPTALGSWRLWNFCELPREVRVSDNSMTWSVRAWRNLPGGRSFYCFDMSGAVERR